MSDERFKILFAILLALSGCAPTLGFRDLPLQPSRVLLLGQELERQSAWRDLGWFELIHRGRSSSALRHFDRALRVDPGDLLALGGRALVLHDQARYPAAVRTWHELLRRLRASRALPPGPSWERPRARLAEVLRPLALRKLSALFSRGERIEEDAILAELRDPETDPLSRDLALDLMRRLPRREGRSVMAELSGHCPERWSVSGPHGQLANLESEPLAPASAPVRLQPTSSCRLALRSGLERAGAGGVFELATAVSASGLPPPEAVISVESDAPWQLLIDGALGYAHDPGERRLASRVNLRLRWPRSGQARIGLRVGAASGSASITVRLFRSDRPGRFQFDTPRSVHSAPAGNPSVSVIPCWSDPATLVYRAGWPAWYRPLASYLSAEQASACGDEDQAYRRIAESTRDAPAFAAPVLLGVVTLVDDDSYPEQVSVEQGRRALAALLSRDPALGRAAYNGAILALRADEAARALGLFRDALRRWPEDGQLWAGLSRVYRQRGWSADEEKALEQAIRRLPGECSLYEDLIAVKQLRRDVGAVARLAILARQCDGGGSEAVARRLREAGKTGEAAAEYRRLADRDPERSWLRREAASALAVAGRVPEALRELQRLVEERSANAEDLVRIADLKIVSGDRAGAVGGLQRAHRLAPWLTPIRTALERLEGRSQMQPYRVDGKAVIAEHKRRGRQIDAPAVLVQDRMVARIFEGGGKLTLTHNIIQVLSKEGIERWGELRLPEGAEVLTLRSIKPDGTTHEPEEIAGKRTVSIPDLEVGDFVEMEYVDVERPPVGYAGTRMQRFYFASFEVPMVVSEYLVIVPRSLELSVDRRGGAPREQRRARGDLVELRFTARDQKRLVPEPRSVSPEEYLPSVRIAAGGSWERIRDSLADRAAPLLRSAWPIQEFARRVFARGGSVGRSRAEALYAEVLTKIAGEGPFLASAARTVARRSGSRYTALTALLREAGIPAELWLVKPRTADQTASSIPNADSHVAPLVFCPLASGPVFLDPRDPAVPFGYIPIELRGAPALRLARGRPPIDWVPPRLAGSREGREVRAEVKLEADGSARVGVVEVLTGSVAVVLRATMRKADPLQLRKLFEGAALNFYFPGAVLDQLSFDPGRSSDQPLRLSYSFHTGNLARAEPGGALRVKTGFFAPHLSMLYLGLARRQRAFQLAHHTPTAVQLTITAPPGLRAIPPSRVRLEGEFGVFSREASVGATGQLRISTSLDIAFMRVTPGDYERFARFARAVDDQFQNEVKFTAR